MAFDYTVVIPVYCNEGTLEYTADKVHDEVFAQLRGKRGRIVFVDDGSTDGSASELLRIRERYGEAVRVIRLSRNFGQFNAVWCGLCHSDGPAVVVSADGQDPIGLIPQMLRRHFDGGVEVVVAVRESRDEGLWRRLTSSLVWRAIRRLANKGMPGGGFDFFLLGPKAKAALLATWQPNSFLQVRILDLGFRREFIPYRRESRKAGVSRWTFSKKLTYMIDGVLGHSYVPIRLMSVFGLLVSGASFALTVFFFVAYFFDAGIVRGWTSIALLVTFIGGVQMLMIGILGEYLWRVLAQVRCVAPYVVESDTDTRGEEAQP